MHETEVVRHDRQKSGEGKRQIERKTGREGETDFPGELWVRTREGGVALPKGGKGDMLHSQLVKLVQLRGQEGRLELANQNGVISEDTHIYRQNSTHIKSQNLISYQVPFWTYRPLLPSKVIKN